VTNFLLEKSRVVHQGLNERSFHIFYQLLNQQDANVREALGLMNPDYFDYLKHSKCYDVKSVNDVLEFRETMKAMSVMGLDESYQMQIFSAVAAVLHLGNISFIETGNYVKVCSQTGNWKKKTDTNIDSMKPINCFPFFFVFAFKKALPTQLICSAYQKIYCAKSWKVIPWNRSGDQRLKEPSCYIITSKPLIPEMLLPRRYIQGYNLFPLNVYFC
jgi:hypothetical protein